MDDFHLQFIVLAKANEENILVLDPEKQKPEEYGKNEFIENWTGRTILIKNKDIRQ